ncbi:MAG TPA: HigA family addiction module antitoxin [Allosphingosinicella sp.]|jgi:addiction module HigA family antidote|nr:HigA family addiction module antitoxin [Allosphingosinicella sp.]
MSRSPITIDADWLHNAHAGELLAGEFMAPLGLDTAALSRALDLSAARLEEVIAGEQAVDADLDLRLARYFGLSEGYFMRLQIQYELLEAKRALNGDLDRIVPHAA